jgi:hypothetical protein
MAKQTEKLSPEVLDSIIKSQNETSEIVYKLGQISIRTREIMLEIKKLEELKFELEEKFDNIGLQLENTVSDLRRKYANGEIDLEAGVVHFETAD